MRVESEGFGVWYLGLGSGIYGLGLRMLGLGFEVQGLGFRVQGLGSGGCGNYCGTQKTPTHCCRSLYFSTWRRVMVRQLQPSLRGEAILVSIKASLDITICTIPLPNRLAGGAAWSLCISQCVGTWVIRPEGVGVWFPWGAPS